MKTGTRVALMSVLFFVQLLYFPINRSAQSGVTIQTPWDSYIPLWAVWSAPYLLGLFWWVGSFLWAAWKMEDALYCAFVVSMLTVMLVSYLIYTFYPTYVERPVLTGNHWTIDLMRLIYGQDRSYNACPSGHTYTTVVIALFWARWYPQKRWLWIALTVLILLSTLFTKQHYLPDLVSGILLAWGGYRFGLWLVANATNSPTQELD